MINTKVVSVVFFTLLVACISYFKYQSSEVDENNITQKNIMEGTNSNGTKDNLSINIESLPMPEIETPMIGNDTSEICDDSELEFSQCGIVNESENSDGLKALSKLVNKSNTSVHQSHLITILTDDNYSNLLTSIDSFVEDKTIETIEYEQKIFDRISQLENINQSNNYDLACNNQVCFAEVKSYDDGIVEEIIEMFNGDQSPLQQSGFLTSHTVTNENEELSLRLVFNSSPTINAIEVPKNGAYSGYKLEVPDS